MMAGLSGINRQPGRDTSNKTIINDKKGRSRINN